MLLLLLLLLLLLPLEEDGDDEREDAECLFPPPPPPPPLLRPTWPARFELLSMERDEAEAYDNFEFVDAAKLLPPSDPYPLPPLRELPTDDPPPMDMENFFFRPEVVVVVLPVPLPFFLFHPAFHVDLCLPPRPLFPAPPLPAA